MHLIVLIDLQISGFAFVITQDVNMCEYFMQQEGWWTYELCYQKKLRQVHLEDDKVNPKVPLSLFSSRYLGHSLANLIW